jgi:hypothetical protein
MNWRDRDDGEHRGGRITAVQPELRPPARIGPPEFQSGFLQEIDGDPV